MIEDISVYSLNKTLTSPEVEKFFRHSTEDLVAYLANKHEHTVLAILANHT